MNAVSKNSVRNNFLSAQIFSTVHHYATDILCDRLQAMLLNLRYHTMIHQIVRKVWKQPEHSCIL